MSIRKMIGLHPQAQGHVNQPLGDAVHHAMYCAKMCLSCADACSAEDMDMRQCIRMSMDCADICTAVSRMAVRNTGSNNASLRAVLRACIEICGWCADECDKHDHDHCKRCAQMCRECAQDCRRALATLGN